MTKEITLVRTVDVSSERVWKAWTDPAEVAEWWGPDGVTIPTCEIDPHVGGALNIVMLAGPELGPLAGQEWPMRGVFKEISEPTKLVFSNDAVDAAGNVLLSGETTIVLLEDGGKTTVTAIVSASGDAPGTEQMLGGMEAGWNQQMDKFVRLLS